MIDLLLVSQLTPLTRVSVNCSHSDNDGRTWSRGALNDLAEPPQPAGDEGGGKGWK